MLAAVVLAYRCGSDVHGRSIEPAASPLACLVFRGMVWEWARGVPGMDLISGENSRCVTDGLATNLIVQPKKIISY